MIHEVTKRKGYVITSHVKNNKLPQLKEVVSIYFTGSKQTRRFNSIMKCCPQSLFSRFTTFSAAVTYEYLLTIYKAIE